MFKRIVAVGAIVTALLSPSVAHATSAIPTASTDPTSAGPESTIEILDLAVADADTTAKMDKLRESDALMALFAGAPSTETVDQYLHFFATNSTHEQVDDFVAKTEGKHFQISGNANSPEVTLVDGPAISTYAFPTCWQGWTAAAAYFAANGLVCGALTVAGGVPGIICNGVFFTVGMLPDFNAPCN